MTASTACTAVPDVRRCADRLVDHAEVGLWAVPVLPGDEGPVLGPGAAAVEADYGVDLLAVAEAAELTGRAGHSALHALPAVHPAPVVLLVGVGEQDGTALRAAGAAVARAGRGKGALATSAWAGDGDLDAVACFVEGLLLASYTFTRGEADPARAPASEALLVGLDPADEALAEAVRRGEVLARAGWRSREIASTPSREKNPQWLADWATQRASDAGLAGVTVWDDEALRAQGFGGLVGVGQGSASPPRLIRLDYDPRPGRTPRDDPRGTAPHVVLVGKGITFDTGGLWLKSADGMATMKRDVTGGAVVLAVMAALRDLDVGIRVTGLVAAAENAVGAGAQRPGDVVRHPDGRTTEVLNTDAEGRLVLADALAYAAEVLRPTVLVDVATLTGAVKVALGQTLGGLYATDDALAASLLAAGHAAGEPLWRLPLVDDYADDIASSVADAQNTGGASAVPPGAGSITAALFLRPFTRGLPWAHLDLASVGDAPGDTGVWTPGPTGFGARALLRWLSTDVPLAGVGR